MIDRARRRMLRRAAVASTSIVIAGCVREERAERTVATEGGLAWDFPSPRAPALRLWPSNNTTPERLKQQISTLNDHGRLAARVEGRDPYFVWRFDNAIAARLVSIELESSDPGAVQLFWSSSTCPTFRESCSLVEQVTTERQWVDFLLDRSIPIRELRFDLPEKTGITLWFSSIEVFDRAEMSARWLGHADGATVVYGADGLELRAAAPDPWMTVTSPGFDASEFDGVELVLRGVPENAPQLFWTGPCEHFDERCSAHFVGADAGALTHRASLARVPTWRGAIRSLRFDPAQEPGDYVIERIAFHAAARAASRKP